jgi:hypothetical protein
MQGDSITVTKAAGLTTRAMKEFLPGYHQAPAHAVEMDTN